MLVFHNEDCLACPTCTMEISSSYFLLAYLPTFSPQNERKGGVFIVIHKLG